MKNEEQFKKDLKEAWNTYMEPLFEDGTLVFECSDTLKEHLMKVGDFTYTDDEVEELINSGKI